MSYMKDVLVVTHDPIVAARRRHFLFADSAKRKKIMMVRSPCRRR